MQSELKVLEQKKSTHHSHAYNIPITYVTFHCDHKSKGENQSKPKNPSSQPAVLPTRASLTDWIKVIKDVQLIKMQLVEK